MATDWRAEYVKAVALETIESVSVSTSTIQQTSKTSVDKVLAFLDQLLMQEGGEWWVKRYRRVKRAATKSDGHKVTEEDKKQLKTLKKRLAAVGSELLVKLPELNASVSSKETPSSVKVRVLQMQLVCRMLRYGALTSKMKEEKKQLKKEIRGLLDRVALLLDAANPPSLADEDADERSPFQEFLQHNLAPRLQMLLPKLVPYLLRLYELKGEDVDDVRDVKDAANAVPPLPIVKPPQCPPELSTPAAAGNSILSALSQERPAKRARPDASELFKEVRLPHQLQQKRIQPRPRKLRRTSKSHSNTNKSSDATVGRSSSSKSDQLLGALVGAKSVKARGSSSETVNLLRHVAAETPAAPRLHRTLSERSHINGRQAALSLSPSTSTKLGGSAPGSIRSSLMPGSTMRRTVSTSAVVMRTPDRPKRLAARSIRKVLVEASPPLRRPNGAKASVPHLLQPKSSRPGSNYPPPLFR